MIIFISSLIYFRMWQGCAPGSLVAENEQQMHAVLFTSEDMWELGRQALQERTFNHWSIS